MLLVLRSIHFKCCPKNVVALRNLKFIAYFVVVIFINERRQREIVCVSELFVSTLEYLVLKIIQFILSDNIYDVEYFY